MNTQDEYQQDGHFIVQCGDRRYLVPRHCPHRGGRLAHGLIQTGRGTITCPLHQSVFRLHDGAQLAGPVCGPLAVREL